MKKMSPSQVFAVASLGNFGRIDETHITDSGMLVVLLRPTGVEFWRSVAIDRLGRTYSIMNAPTEDGNPLVDYWSVHADPVPGKVAIQDREGTVRYEAQDKQRRFKHEE